VGGVHQSSKPFSRLKNAQLPNGGGVGGVGEGRRGNRTILNPGRFMRGKHN